MYIVAICGYIHCMRLIRFKQLYSLYADPFAVCSYIRYMQLFSLYTAIFDICGCVRRTRYMQLYSQYSALLATLHMRKCLLCAVLAIRGYIHCVRQAILAICGFTSLWIQHGCLDLDFC